MDPLNALKGQKKSDAPKAEAKPKLFSEDITFSAPPPPPPPAAAALPTAVATPVAAQVPGMPMAVATPVAGPSGYPKQETKPPMPPIGDSPGLDMSFPGMLPGEKVVEAVKSCALQVQNPFCEVPGRIVITPYRLKFMTPKGGLRKDLLWMRDVKYFDVPFGLVETMKDERVVTITGATELRVTIACKDLRSLVFLLKSEQECRMLLESVGAFGTPGNPAMLFAFKLCDALKKQGLFQDQGGWSFYDAEQDHARMGIDTPLIPNPQCPWRVTELNRQYRLCSSYPSVLAMPRRMPDQALREVAAFRKRGRLPALSWCGGPELSFASLWRCSQTTEGIMGTKCIEDQSMLNAIRLGNGCERDLLLIDLRPKVSAWVNKAGGGGFESYPNCRMIWGGIDNIHVVRDAWRAMGSAVARLQDAQVGSWLKDVASSGWYDYIGAILSCTLKVVTEILGFKASVVIHCSDGWDRTAQVSSLSMLCLDPHYRTQVGFLKLVQKEWCSFGHRFRTRLAIGEAPSSEYSPVIVQWLECVYQLLQQFPSAFEFSADGLLRLADEVFTNRYGTFFGDNEQERRPVESQTLSLWSALLSEDEFDGWRNPTYEANRVRLYPSVCQANYGIWEAYWFRFHARGAREEAPMSPRSDVPPPRLTEAERPVERPVEAERDEPSLFTPAELAAPVAAPEPKPEPKPEVPLFAEDDDEDIFAKKPGLQNLKAKETNSEAPEAPEAPEL